jgi:hypothetical protein
MDMKINGKGLPVRPKIVRVSLPNDLKKTWPDLRCYHSASFDNRNKASMNLSPLLHDFKVKKHERILDIGAFNNVIVETIQRRGFYNAAGIDVNPEILNSPYGMQINFRDLRLNEKFRVIHFSYILSHFGDATPCQGKKPSLQLLANKIYLHLLPEGYLFFRDESPNIPRFLHSIRSIGFKKRISRTDRKSKTVRGFIFQKP